MAGSRDDDLVTASAENLVGWHECCIRALGWASASDPIWWTRPAREPSIYFTAIQRASTGPDPTRVVEALAHHLHGRAELPEAVCVTRADLDLSRFGLTVHSDGRWYARRPDAPAPAEPTPGGLEIVTVTSAADLATFEATSETAFSGRPPPPGQVYAPGLLADPAMTVLLGRCDGEPVAGAMAYRAAGVVGIYSVGTVPAHRERGHATALTRAAVDVAGDDPVVLQPSLAAARLYRRLGFGEIGRFAHWGRSTPPPPEA